MLKYLTLALISIEEDDMVIKISTEYYALNPYA